MKATEQVKYYCQECGKELIGRKDKKFCSISCKNKYNNRRNQTIRKYREDTINRLSRNYEILESLLMEKQPYIGLEELSDLGFDYDCFTSRQKSRTGHDNRSCFDISYDISTRKIFNIKRKDLTKL